MDETIAPSALSPFPRPLVEENLSHDGPGEVPKGLPKFLRIGSPEYLQRSYLGSRDSDSADLPVMFPSFMLQCFMCSTVVFLEPKKIERMLKSYG